MTNPRQLAVLVANPYLLPSLALQHGLLKTTSSMSGIDTVPPPPPHNPSPTVLLIA